MMQMPNASLSRTVHNLIEPQHERNYEFYVAQKLSSTDFEALELRNAQSEGDISSNIVTS